MLHVALRTHKRISPHSLRHSLITADLVASVPLFA
jgi:hypothetical protein